MRAKPVAAHKNPVVVCRMESQLGMVMKKQASSPKISEAKMNSRMMICSVSGSSMPKFCWMKNGRTKSASTSRQIKAFSYSPRRMEDTSVARTIRRSTRYTANTLGCRRIAARRSRAGLGTFGRCFIVVAIPFPVVFLEL